MPAKMFAREYALRHGGGIIYRRTWRVAVEHGRIVSPSRTELPGGQPRDRRGAGIKQQLVEIEPMAVLGLIRAVHAIAIQLASRDPFNPDVPHVTRAVASGIQINHSGRRGIFRTIKQLQPNAAGMSAEERKVHSFATGRGSERQWHTSSNSSSRCAHRCHRMGATSRGTATPAQCGMMRVV